MQQYDFDEIIERGNTGSVKWDAYGLGVLPLWVADMDFRSPEPVIEALRARVAHGVFGYGHPSGMPLHEEMKARLEQAAYDSDQPTSETLRDVILAWLERVYGWKVAPEALLLLPGVITGFNLACRAVAAAGDGVLVQTPVYRPILAAPAAHGLVRQENELVPGTAGRYTIDMDAFGASVDERTRLFILCNPHNPVGRVWERGELEQMAEICLRHDVTICSDEIHADLVFPGHPHIPIASLSREIGQHSITLMAPSKTFNIAGLDCAFAVIENADLRSRFEKVRRGLVGEVNILGITAAHAAYDKGQPWLDGLLVYLERNRDALADAVAARLPGIRVNRPDGTYLAWLDCRDAGLPSNPFEFFLKEARVALNDGLEFGRGGQGFVRLNFGCPRSVLDEALQRMQEALERRLG